MNKPKLSVIIPAYNESENLKSGVLEKVEKYLQAQDYGYEVLIVDDGSKDQTISLVEQIIKNKPNFRLIKNPHGGKAVTVMTGLLQANGDIILFTDMDQATPLNQIEKFFPLFDKGFNVVIGARGGRKGAPIVRKITAWGFSALRGLILGLPFSDTQCGFKAFTKDTVKAVFPGILQRWQKQAATGSALNAGFDVETLFLAKKYGFKVTEVKVDWQYVGTERFRLVHDAVEAIKDMIRIRMKDLQGGYDKTAEVSLA